MTSGEVTTPASQTPSIHEKNIELKELILKEGYLKFPYHLAHRFGGVLTLDDIAVFSCILEYIKDDPDFWECRPKQATIAHKLGISRQRVNTCLKRMAKNGFVKMEYTGRASHLELMKKWLPGVQTLAPEIQSADTTSILHSRIKEVRTEIATAVDQKISLRSLDKGKTGGRQGNGIEEGERDRRRDSAPTPGQIQWPLLASKPHPKPDLSSQLEISICKESDGVEKVMDDELRFSYHKQVGPRREKTKHKLGQTSKRKLSAYQTVHDQFCEVMAKRGYDQPSPHVPDAHIAACLEESSLEEVCRAIEFSVCNWDRMTEFFPRGRFAPMPNLWEASHVWVVRLLKLYVNNNGKMPQSTDKKSKQPMDNRSERQKHIDEANKERILRQIEETKKKYLGE